ncbi:zinc metallochaperone AztD [Plantibacter sp. M259]|uniref:zinc metallochaperone AztD n=1 Tax=Plantibacter sp. M259 TaxID=2583822 RepID=UPI00111040A7|nr:zinc metallochaperone AztD [Plantibacter sp. M259]
MQQHHRSPLAPRLKRGRVPFLAVGTAAALLLTGCSTASGSAPDPSASTSADPQSRITLTYDGGLLVLDAASLEVVGDLPLAGFNRVNAAGDGRHVLVTTTKGFQVLDTGTWTDEDGTSKQADPVLTDLVFPADTAGHVVRHADKTILFADGSGDTTIFDSADLLEATDELPETETIPSEAAHHGVAIELEDGTVLSTIGTPDARTGVRVLDDSRTEIARNEQCPSVHGEGTVKDEVVVFGCSDGVLVYDSGVFTKIQAPDAYGRTGNQYVSETSSIAVGDYNSDPDAEGYDLRQLAFTDTVTKTTKIVDLPEGVGYTWRDVARGPSDEVIVLGNDGSLHILDEQTGAVTDTIEVIDAWEPPAEWQDAHPALVVQDGVAYVTDPATKSIHAVDLASGDITTGELPGVPNEIAVVTG